MEDHKRLLLPAITAIALHGFLISFPLPKHVPMKPILMGDPIRVEINTFSSTASLPEKNQTDKPAKTTSTVTSQEKIVPKKVSVQPIDPARHRQKISIKAHLPKKSAVAGNTMKANAPQQKQVEKQMTALTGPSPMPAVTPGKKSNSAMQKNLPQAETSAVPILQKAIPVYRQNQQPHYPAVAKRRGYEGEILLNVLVNREGKVAEIKIQQSSSHQSLDTAALEAVRNWLFAPATEGGRAVSMWITIPIEFRLQANNKS